ncbi:MAG TPA: PAS domain-containing sensor histidine kinase [Acidimicrobiales bacterium]|nr:PAS domain-containing sensor histidine kinase [Acidimicrobiales bacterium]
MTVTSIWPGQTQGGHRPATEDTVAVRFVAGVRLLLVVTAAAVGSYLPGLSSRKADLMLLIGLGWVPWAMVVLFASEGVGSRLALFGGPVGDLALLTAVELLHPSAAVPVLIGYLVVVVFAVYTMERALAGGIGAAAVVLSWLSQIWIAHSHRVSAAVLVAFTAAVVAMVSLLERTAVLRSRVDSRYERLQTKAETIVANVADAIVVTDAEGRITQCNPAAGRVLGRPHHQLVGQTCALALTLHIDSRAIDCSQGCGLMALAGAADAADVEVWRWAREGVRQPLLASATEVADDDASQEVLHSIRDITRLKQAEEAKTLFLATATHELKTPLTVINGFAETLQVHPDMAPEDRAAALAAISSRGRELAAIIDRLLMSSRIEAGRVSVSLGPVVVAPLAEERGVTFARATDRPVTVLAPEELPFAHANANALITVIDHLLDNAAKYSPPGSPLQIEVKAEGDLVTVAVTDHGVGMDEEQARHCFDRFWQAESTDVRRFGGAGIGLYIVRSLVEAMGASVSVRSAPGQGSTFTIALATEGATVSGSQSAGAETLTEAEATAGRGEPTSIREFMRQIGVPERTAP